MKSGWDSFEISWDFEKHPLMKFKKETIEKREEIRVITAIRHGPYIRRTGNPPDPGLHPPKRLLRAGGRTAPSDG